MKSIFKVILMVLLVSAFFVQIALAAEPTAPVLKISDAQFLNQDPDPAQPGSNVDVRFKIQNVGREDIDNMVFELLPDYPLSLYQDEDRFRYLGKVDAGQIGENSYVLFYRLQVAPDALEGDYTLRLRYSTDGGNNWRTIDSYSIRVKTLDTLVSVQSVKTDPEVVSPGQPLNLSFELKNLEGNYIKNVHITLGLVQTTSAGIVELPFSPVDSTNEKVIKFLDSGRSDSVSFKLITDPDAQTKTYKIPIAITYSDDSNVDHTISQLSSITVNAEPKLSVYLDPEDPFIVGQEGTLSVKFINRGIGNIQFMYATLQDIPDCEILSTKEIYVGNIDSDDYQTAEFKIKCTKESDPKTFNVKAEYLDAANNKYSKDITLSGKVYSYEAAVESGLIKKSNTLGILITISIVIIGIIAYRIFRKRKRKNAR